MNRPYVRLYRDDVAILLVDHQTGLLSNHIPDYRNLITSHTASRP
ncbi:hypothetical protein [Komagataeibacter swingsii]|nr:hypothetical protein [Komagataeibacter swingsii]